MDNFELAVLNWGFGLVEFGGSELNDIRVVSIASLEYPIYLRCISSASQVHMQFLASGANEL